MENAVDLSSYDNSWYSPGRSKIVQAFWFFAGLPLLRAQWNASSSFKVFLLRMFGAGVGTGVVLKPGLRVKYPWKLSIGNHSWIGEYCWLDNLAQISIGNNVCVSQGAYLCTGSHDWSDPRFGLITKPIRLGDGSWVGAKSVLTAGVEVGECGVSIACSLITKNIPAFEIHGGNPAKFIRHRMIWPQMKTDEYR